MLDLIEAHLTQCETDFKNKLMKLRKEYQQERVGPLNHLRKLVVDLKSQNGSRKK